MSPPTEPTGNPLRRVFPDDVELSASEAISHLTLAERAPAHRPYVVCNMISSADGKATISGKTRGLGSPCDRELFRNLRTQTDAVMAGAGTVRTERYGRIVRDPALREKRHLEGLSHDPLAVIVSGRLELRADLPLLADADSSVVVLTGSGQTLEGCRAQVDYIRARTSPLPLARMLATLRHEYGVRSVLCEGGPTLNSHLLVAGLVDELFLSVTAKLAGGHGPTIVEGAEPSHPVDTQLVWLLTDGTNLFARYRVAH